MKVLLINEGNSDNLGDQAINFVTHKILESHGAKLEWQSYSCHEITDKRRVKDTQYIKPNVIKSFVANTIFGKSFLRKRWWNANQERFEKYENANYDLVLIGGGQLLNNSWLYPFLFKKWTDTFKNHNLNTFAIGLGSNFNFYDKFLIKKSLANCNVISVRDQYSKSYIEKWFELKCNYMPDPVFKISDFIEVKKAGSQAIVLPVSFEHVFLKYNNPFPLKQYLDIWINKINEYALNYAVVIVSITDLVQDRQIFENLKKHFQTHYNIKFIVPDNMKHLVSLIGSSESVYSGRMHALIIGYSYNLNCETYTVSKKLEIFDREYLLDKGQNIISIKSQIEKNVLNILNR